MTSVGQEMKLQRELQFIKMNSKKLKFAREFENRLLIWARN